jgi:hypothetical protein
MDDGILPAFFHHVNRFMRMKRWNQWAAATPSSGSPTQA